MIRYGIKKNMDIRLIEPMGTNSVTLDLYMYWQK